jgi:DNA-directed RNA polymerase alpha subunit
MTTTRITHLTFEETELIRKKREQEEENRWEQLRREAQGKSEKIRISMKEITRVLLETWHGWIIPRLEDLIATTLEISDKTGDDVLLLPIDTKAWFNFSNRIIKWLKEAGIFYIWDLLVVSHDYLLKKVINIGQWSLSEIDMALKLNWLSIGQWTDSQFIAKWKEIRPT